MSPERSERISRIVRSALGRKAAERSAYLDGACAEDEELRAAVERLLASQPGAASEVSAAQTRPEVVPGRTSLGHYQIIEKLGSGGMGTVYLAKDARLGRRVALKLLPVHMAADDASVRRFEQEARAASALNHPNILTVHDIGELEGRRYIATEYVEGRDLRRRMTEAPLTLSESLDACAQVASGLAKAHAAGILHRDIKPENVMVDDEGHAKLLDFGIAKQFAAPRHAPDPEDPTSAHVNTESGIVLGTSTYMSPEQVRGLDLDARTDLWSLGCVLYELVAGRPPFSAPTYGDLVVAILYEEPPPAGRARAGLPEELERILRRALAKRREDRYQSAGELREDLRRLQRRLEFQQGAAHESGRERPHAAQPRPQTTTEQRKQVTVLFADARGLEELAGGCDAEEMSELLDELWRRVDGVVAEHGGTVVRHVGDTVLALWGAREAREDDPERAVRAALAMQREAAEAARLCPRPGSAGLRPEDSGEAAPALLRVGVSTGLVLLGESAGTGGPTATGEPVQLASRLQQSAAEGCVLIAHDTYRHVRGVFDVQSPETLKLGGRAGSVEVYRVQRAKPRAFRVQTRGVEGVETRMVGRKAELRRLMDALEEVFEERELQVVTVLAEAGLGKSRLLYEFSNWHELLPDAWYVFNGRGSEATEGLPYALVRDVFSFRFEIQDSDPPELAREKLERGIAQMGTVGGEEARTRAHFIGQLIGLDYSGSEYLSGILEDARQIRDRAFRYAAQFFADASRRYPIVVYLDDIHWADDGSLDFVDYLARSCESAPVFVLCLARPTLLERRPAWGEGVERHARVQLQPLSKKESRQLVEEILRRARGVPAELRELVVGGAEGNPFYVEELIKMLIDQSVIVPGAFEWEVDAGRLGEVQVPPTLTGVLQARLDKLTPVEKSVLQRASVVGRVFWDGAVRHLGAGQTGPIRRETSPATEGPTDGAEGGDVHEALESLRRKELVHRREASGFAGAREYSFKHALLRDVTYESVLRRERREYHRRAAEWLARHSGGRAGEYAGLIAEHYERAQEPRAAAEWYGRAGRRARETHAPEAAIRYYRRALEFLPAASRGAGEQASLALRAEWCEGLGEVLRVQARYAESIVAYAEMRAAAEGLGDAAAQARAWNEIALVQSSQGDNRAAFESTQRAEGLARAAGDSDEGLVELARALNLQSQAGSRLGDPEGAMRLADRALVLSSSLGETGKRARADSLKSLGMAHHTLGRFEPADQFKEQALQLFRELGDRRAVGNLLNSLGETARLRGDYSTALSRYTEALTIAREIGNRNGEILYLGNLGAAHTGLGDYAAAESDLREATRMASEAGYVGLSENYRFLAEALLGQNKLEEALSSALRALELGREIENQEHVAEAQRALGLVASRLGRPVEVGGRTLDAPALFAESLSLFTRIPMEAQRARTLRDWGRHELAHGNPARGRDLLHQARQIFTRLNMPLELARTDLPDA